MSLSIASSPGEFLAKYVVLPIGLNATAGAFAAVVLSGRVTATVTTVSGALSGLLQSVATVPRNSFLAKIEENLSGAKKVVALALTMLAIYAIHVPLLMGVAHLLTGHQISIWTSLVFTAVGGGVAALEYLAAQKMVDGAAQGKASRLF